MDWNAFLEKTPRAADVDSFAKLAPMIGVTDGAIHHYRVGRNVPQVWVVAECLRIQGHPEPEKAAVQIMKNEARTSPERAFYKKLAATTILLLFVVVPFLNPTAAHATSPRVLNAEPSTTIYIMRSRMLFAVAFIRRLLGLKRDPAPAAVLA